MTVKRILHVGVATSSIEATSKLYSSLGLCVHPAEIQPRDGVKVAMIPVGESSLELLEPLNPQSPVHKFIEERGQGIHHVAFEVDDLPGSLEQLRNAGISLIDQVPRQGAEGRSIAFVHPRSAGGVLIELCESVSD